MYDCWLDVSEECWKGLLEELKQLDVVLEDWVFDSFNQELQEGLEGELWRNVLSVDLGRHCISPIWIKVMYLLFDLLDRCQSGRPAFGEEAGHNLKAEEIYECLMLLLLLFS